MACGEASLDLSAVFSKLESIQGPFGSTLVGFRRHPDGLVCAGRQENEGNVIVTYCSAHGGVEWVQNSQVVLDDHR